jgi:hypothetical protein
MREDQKLFPRSLADRYKESGKEKYRPSNGTEGEMFQERWCHQCTKDTEGDPCNILTSAFFFDLDDPEYPCEWTFSPEGQPMCTAFQRIGTEEPIKPAPGQLDLF